VLVFERGLAGMHKPIAAAAAASATTATIAVA